MSRAQEKALFFYPKLFSERLGIDTHFEDRRIAFEHGYESAVKDIIEQAMEWLNDNAWEFAITRSKANCEEFVRFDSKGLLVAFKKAMTEE